MAHHNKILEDKLECPICKGLSMKSYVKNRWEKSGNLMSLNDICPDCGGRVKIIENVNGFLVLRKYIMKKDQVKLIRK